MAVGTSAEDGNERLFECQTADRRTMVCRTPAIGPRQMAAADDGTAGSLRVLFQSATHGPILTQHAFVVLPDPECRGFDADVRRGGLRITVRGRHLRPAGFVESDVSVVAIHGPPATGDGDAGRSSYCRVREMRDDWIDCDVPLRSPDTAVTVDRVLVIALGKLVCQLIAPNTTAEVHHQSRHFDDTDCDSCTLGLRTYFYLTVWLAACAIALFLLRRAAVFFWKYSRGRSSDDTDEHTSSTEVRTSIQAFPA